MVMGIICRSGAERWVIGIALQIVSLEPVESNTDLPGGLVPLIIPPTVPPAGGFKLLLEAHALAQLC